MTQEQRNWLERLGERVPGYSGYVERERRRDIDKIQREHLADRLRALKSPLTEVVRELTSTGRLFEVTPIEPLLKKLDRIENRVRFASYGYSGFFDVAKIDEAQLASIYQFDLALVEHVDALEAKAKELSAHAGSAAELKTACAWVESTLDELNRKFDERSRAIEGFGGGEASGGRSMFDA